MITSKYIKLITAVMLSLSLALCGFLVYSADASDTVRVTEYEKKMFGDNIVNIDIQANKNDWQRLLVNAQEKEWISGDLTIDGQKFSTVGIRTKGNASLTQVSESGGGRYSLQFKANKYIKGETFYGLDTFCINNLFDDATYMKEYIAYDIMRYIGVPAPLTNYAKVTVNGEDYGFMLMLERYEEAFLNRVYSTTAGQLYNVKKEKNGQGGSLLYIGDNVSLYTEIFNNAVFGKKSAKHEERVVMAIKNLNAGTNLEDYFDVDEILRYFAAHTVVVNTNSYATKQHQNYYVYERGKVITVLPWSYRLAFGGIIDEETMSASEIVNLPIDTPVIGVSMDERPLLNKLLGVDKYREKYHEYLREITDGYFESGRFKSVIAVLDAKINGYVKDDVSAFYSYEQYESASAALSELALLRAASIKGQLDGIIPSTANAQNADGSSLIDVSGFDFSALCIAARQN